MHFSDPEIQSPPPETPRREAAEPWKTVRWVFLGGQGLRSGWSVLAFVLLIEIFNRGVAFALIKLHLVSPNYDFAVPSVFFELLGGLLALAAAAAVLARIERRESLLAYNLTGPSRLHNFLSGLATGFVSLTALVGVLAWGGWLHFGPVTLSGMSLFKFGALWAATFLLVGFNEEGYFRCFLLFTLTRGINIWWALGLNGAICLALRLTAKGNALWGVYLMALLGIFPCLWLHLRKIEGAGFWQAAWVTSTLFGFLHVRPGENWFGVFSAAAVGFLCCVSVRLTGSAWWAIGCHAAWDWAETFFYGTANSGLVAPGHYLTTTPAGNPLWSGGAAGPEGSLLVIGAMLLWLVVLLVMYRRRKSAAGQCSAEDVR